VISSEETVVQPAVAESRDVVGRRLLWFFVAMTMIGFAVITLAFLSASADARSARAELDRLGGRDTPMPVARVDADTQQSSTGQPGGRPRLPEPPGPLPPIVQLQPAAAIPGRRDPFRHP
jgi:hypothetical protein